MCGSCSALFTILVTAVAGHLLDPEAREALNIFKQRMLEDLGMTSFPNLRAINTTNTHMQYMMRRYYDNVKRNEEELILLRKSGYRNKFLLFQPDLDFDFLLESAWLKFPNYTKINVTTAVKQWAQIRTPFISIKCDEPQCTRAKLELLVHRNRVKRAICSNNCCKKSLRISFKEIGWDWIVQPTDFEAFYCKGRCKDMTDDFASTHALLQTIVKISGKNVSRPCCAPKKLRGLDILYYNDKNPPELVLSYQKGMIVKDCACV